MTWTDHRTSGSIAAILASLALALAADSSRADEIHTAKRSYNNASIRHFDGEFVIFSSSSGDAVARKVDEIEAIFVDSADRFEEFNRAEQAYKQHRYRDAAQKYKHALQRARGFWTHLIRIRHLRACDAAGDFDQAVEAYLTIVRTMPEKSDLYMPSNLEGAVAGSHARALQVLEQALPKVTDPAAYWQLEALRLTILEGTESDRAEEIAQQIIARLQRGSAPNSRYRLQIIAIRVEVKHNQYQVALGHINRALEDAGEVYLPELLFMKGKCLLGLAQDRDGFIRAGLGFMRVVVHFPKSRLCARSMFRVGEVHEKINRIPKAIELYEGCKELPGANDEIVQLADAAVRRLQDGQ